MIHDTWYRSSYCGDRNHKIISLLLYNCNCTTVMNHNVNNWHVGYLICDTKEVLIHRLITTSLSGGTLSNPFLSGRQAQSICWTLDGLQFLCRYPEMGTARKHGKHRGEPYRPEVGLQDIQIWAETEVRSALERWRRTECEDWLFRASDLDRYFTPWRNSCGCGDS